MLSVSSSREPIYPTLGGEGPLEAEALVLDLAAVGHAKAGADKRMRNVEEGGEIATGWPRGTLGCGHLRVDEQAPP